VSQNPRKRRRTQVHAIRELVLRDPVLYVHEDRSLTARESVRLELGKHVAVLQMMDAGEQGAQALSRRIGLTLVLRPVFG
jgi:hypothetical protein